MATKDVTSSSIPNYVLIPRMLLPWISSAAFSLVAYSIRDWNSKYRWLIGFGGIRLNAIITKYSMDSYKAILPSSVVEARVSCHWLLINNIFAQMWGVFNGFFGGNRYYGKHGIDSHRKAVIDSLCSGQVYFRKNENARKKAIKKVFRIAGYLSAGYGMAKVIKTGLVPAKFIESNRVLHMQVLGLMCCIQIFASNIPAAIHYLIFSGNDDMEVVEPYGFVFFAKSIRDFWKQWSRPIGEFLRYMVYEPLGGRNRFWLSVPALFAMNCTLHYDQSYNMYGYKPYSVWNKAFAVMGLSMATYMLSENIFLKKKKMKERIVDASQLEMIDESVDLVDDGLIDKDSLTWRVWSYGLANAAMLTTLYIVKDKAVIMNLENGCNTILFEGLGLDVKI